MSLRRCCLPRRVLLSVSSYLGSASSSAISQGVGGFRCNSASSSLLHEILAKVQPIRFYSPRAHPGRPHSLGAAKNKESREKGEAGGVSPAIPAIPASIPDPGASSQEPLPATGEDEARTRELEALLLVREGAWERGKLSQRGDTAPSSSTLSSSGSSSGSSSTSSQSSSSSGPQFGSSLLVQRSLNVSIVGPPNAGKSTLTNTLLGHKVTAVSRKTNTTRSEMLGVLTQGITQLVLYDTPGMLALPRGADASRAALGKDKLRLANIAWKFTENTELFLFLVDAARQITRVDPRVLQLARCLPREHPHGVLVLNKVDAVASPAHLLPLTSDLMDCFPFKSCFMISAAHNDGVEDLKSYLFQHAVPRPWEMPRGFVTYRQKERFVLEVVRERAFEWLHQEVPYGIEFEFLDWKEYAKSGDLKIELQLNVGDEHQKNIVRSKLREIGEGACLEIRREFGRQVHLFLHVKVVARH